MRRPRIAPSAVVWLLVGAVYFLIPLIATFLFSIKDAQTGKCCSLSAYGFILHDPQFWTTIKLSFRLALETIVVGLLLFVPTLYLGAPEAARGCVRSIGFLALVPFVVPPIILVVGLLEFFKDDLHAPFWFLGKPDLFLVGAYVILAFPYIYFSLDAGFRAIDVHTLTEASQSLGAGWRTTLGRVILPNIRVAALAGAFLTLAIVMGEFTIASLHRLQHVPDVHPVHQRDAGLPRRGGDADELRDHVGGDALAAPDRPARRPAHGARGDRQVGGWRTSSSQGLYRAFGPVVALAGDRSRARARASSSRCSARAAAARRRRCASWPASTGPTRGGSSSTAATSRACPRTSATWGWSSRRTASSRT